MPYFTSIFKAFPKVSFRELELPIKMGKHSKQRFVCHSKINTAAVSGLDTKGQLIKDDDISTVVQNEDGLILKFVKARRWHEYYKVFYGASRTSKEVISNVRLKELGFHVPNIVEYGIALVPTHFWGYTGFYVMEPAPGLGEAVHHLKELDENSRAIFIDKLIKDLEQLKAHRIIYGDLALRNIFCSADGDLCWIDTGIDEYSPFQQKRFNKKWNKSLKQFIEWEGSNKRLNDLELDKIKALLN